MKKAKIVLLMVIITLTCASCGQKTKTFNPDKSQLQSICELAVMDCYYHNVAKFREEDAAGVLWWQKDKHFWIEYSGVVKYGIDASLVTVEADGTQITVTIPNAKVLDCKIHSDSLTKDSYIIDRKSADITAEDEIKAFEVAQNQLKEAASNDRILLAEARQRAQSLLEDYFVNIGNAIGKEYTIKWVYVDENGKPMGKE